MLARHYMGDGGPDMRDYGLQHGQKDLAKLHLLFNILSVRRADGTLWPWFLKDPTRLTRNDNVDLIDAESLNNLRRSFMLCQLTVMRRLGGADCPPPLKHAIGTQLLDNAILFTFEHVAAPPSRPPANIVATQLRPISRAPRSGINLWSPDCPATPCFFPPGPRVVPLQYRGGGVGDDPSTTTRA